jgi:hypothetical protein
MFVVEIQLIYSINIKRVVKIHFKSNGGFKSHLRMCENGCGKVGVCIPLFI